ncbi:MAG: hypothetical protein RLZZ226_1698 [Pseudomonadota bacterium]|jgi:peroxiredoxin
MARLSIPRRGLAILAAAAVIAGGLWLTPPEAPDIQLAALDGSRIRLTSLRGQPVLVSFWASDCRACLEEMPALQALYTEFAPQGLHLLAVAMPYDPPSRVLSLARERQIPYPVILDPDGAVTRAFGSVSLIPRHFLIDAKGRIRQDILGKIDPATLRPLLLTLLEKT